MAKKLGRVPAGIVEAFDRFFTAYPYRRPNPRARALVAFARAVADLGADPEALIAAAGRWAAEVREERIKSLFVPHAATWLNQRDYEDYLTADVPAPAETAQPAPEHPMDWARPFMTAGAWTSWFSRLTLVEGDGETIITAPTAFVRDRIDQDHRLLFTRRYGRVTWRIEG